MSSETPLLSDLCTIWSVLPSPTPIPNHLLTKNPKTAAFNPPNTAVPAVQHAPAPSPVRAATNSGPNAAASAIQLPT